MEIKVSDERKGSTNYVTNNILECVSFWNRVGKDTYEKNKLGEIGSAKSNEWSRSMVYDDFILEMLLVDCRVFTNSKTAKESGIKFECGRTRSHVWVHENDNRKLMIYF